MSTFESQSLYIDFSRLPPPNVIESIAYEKILERYRADVLAKNPELAQALKLEQSPTNIILEAEAYGEMIVRARINAAGRALMLPFSTGSDLDNLAVNFQQGFPHPIARLPLVDNPRSFTTNPEDWESDARFRRRIQLVPEAYSSAGSEGSYIFHGLSSDASISDISVTRINDRGGIKISVMNSGSDPAPTRAQMDNVTRRLTSKGVKPLTDVLSIAPAKVVNVDLDVTIQLYPGPDAGLVMNDIQVGLNKLRAQVSRLGFDLPLSALYAVLRQEGVHDVKIASPTKDIVLQKDSCVRFRSATIKQALSRTE